MTKYKNRALIVAVCLMCALAIIAGMTAANLRVSAEESETYVYCNNVNLITEINTSDAYDSLKESDVDIAIFKLNESGKIVLNGETADFDADKIGAVVPAFYVNNEQSASAAATLIVQSSPNAYVVSDNPALVKSVRSACTYANGIIDFRAKVVSATEVRNTVNSNFCKCALISANKFGRADVEVMRKLLITVYAEANVKEDIYSALSFGADGILSSDIAAVQKALTVGGANMYAPRPYVVSHRGSSQATRGAASPYYENTVAAARAAYDKYSADFVEIDLYLSKDGRVVISHDSSIDRMTNGTGSIESMTLSEIRQYKVTGGLTEPEFTDEVAVLDDYFAEFKNDDLYFLLEIKSQKTECVDAAMAVIEKYGMENRVNFISFFMSQLEYARELNPDISISYLTNGEEYDVSSAEFIQDVQKTVNPYNASLSPIYESMNAEGVLALARRGIKVNAWTINMEALFFRELKNSGYATFTTDFCSYLAKFPYEIVPESTSITLRPGDNLTINAKVVRWDKKDENATFTVISITDGFELTALDDGSYSVSGTEGKILLYYEGKQYSIVSEPITVKVSDEAETPKKGCGCGSSADAASAAVFAAAALLALSITLSVRRKKRKTQDR